MRRYGYNRAFKIQTTQLCSDWNCVSQGSIRDTPHDTSTSEPLKDVQPEAGEQLCVVSFGFSISGDCLPFCRGVWSRSGHDLLEYIN